jgi:hypothetical protein
MGAGTAVLLAWLLVSAPSLYYLYHCLTISLARDRFTAIFSTN